MSALFRGICTVVLIMAWCVVRPNQWRMSQPVAYELILSNNEVLTLKAIDPKVQHRVDSVGLKSALLTFKNKEVLVLGYDKGRLSSMSLRTGHAECLVPDSMVARVDGVHLDKTLLTWPGNFKRASNAPQFCVQLNYWLEEYETPPRFEPKTICFAADCSRIGSEMMLIGTR